MRRCCSSDSHRYAALLQFRLSPLCGAVAGAVQSRECIEAIIRLAYEEQLFLLADEVRGAPQRPHRKPIATP